MFWNTYSNFNPAMSGLKYQQHGAISYQTIAPSLSGSHQELQANYNMRLSGKHGVGINYSGDYNAFTNNKIALNYNYQFDLKKAGKLSTGVATGVGRSEVREEYFDSFGAPYGSDPYNYFHLSLGTAYTWKNLILGISTSNLFPQEDPAFSFNSGNRVGMNAHVSYGFELGKNLELTPRAIFTTYNGFHQLGLNVSTTFKKKFSLGLTAFNRDHYAVNLGWDIKEKYRVAYSFGRTFSKLSNSSSYGTHEFSIGYIIKNQAKKFVNLGTPNF